MKLSTGRGIKFFKKPIFSTPKTFFVKTYNFSKEHINRIVKKGKNK